MKINVEFDNLSEAQAVALEEFFAVWLFLKEKNMSMMWKSEGYKFKFVFWKQHIIGAMLVTWDMNPDSLIRKAINIICCCATKIHLHAA